MAGSTTVTHHALGALRRIQIDWVADAAAATVPDTILPAIEGRIVAVETNPGAVAPTDNYDVTAEDAEGVDRLNGAGNNRDTATTEIGAAVFASTAVAIPVDSGETLTLKIGGNSVNSATGRILIFYVPAGAS